MTSPLSNFFRLSSGQFAERDRIEASREIIGRSLMKMNFELRPDVPFNVDMVFRALPDVVLATGTCSAMDCLRTPDLIEDDGLVLTIPVSGHSILHVRGNADDRVRWILLCRRSDSNVHLLPKRVLSREHAFRQRTT